MSPDHRNSEIREQVKDSVATAVLRPWQNELFELLEQPVVPRKINWWFERTGNTGKTFMAKYLVLKFDDAVVQYMRKEDMGKTSRNRALDSSGRPNRIGDGFEVAPETVAHLLDALHGGDRRFQGLRLRGVDRRALR